MAITIAFHAVGTAAQGAFNGSSKPTLPEVFIPHDSTGLSGESIQFRKDACAIQPVGSPPIPVAHGFASRIGVACVEGTGGVLVNGLVLSSVENRRINQQVFPLLPHYLAYVIAHQQSLLDVQAIAITDLKAKLAAYEKSHAERQAVMLQKVNKIDGLADVLAQDPRIVSAISARVRVELEQQAVKPPQSK